MLLSNPVDDFHEDGDVYDFINDDLDELDNEKMNEENDMKIIHTCLKQTSFDNRFQSMMQILKRSYSTLIEAHISNIFSHVTFN